MDESNDQTVVATVPESDMEAQQVETGEPKPERPKLTPEEQLAIYERRAKRLRKELGVEEAPKPSSNPDSSDLLQKAFLRTAGISDAEEQAEAIKTAKKWDMTVDQLVDDADWQSKLERMRTTKANELATSDIKGSGQASQANQTPEFWLAKGVPPTPDQVPDAAVRRKIVKAFIANKGSSKKFYSD